MDSKQKLRLKMYYNVERYGMDNAYIAVLAPPFQDAFNLFRVKIVAIENALQQADYVTRSLEDKISLKEMLCQVATDIAVLLHNYAVEKNDAVLQDQFSYAMDELMEMEKYALVKMLDSVRETGFECQVALEAVGITAGLFEILGLLLDDYRRPATKLRNPAILRRKLRLTMHYHFMEADRVLKYRLDKTVNLFKFINPDFVVNYKALRVISSYTGKMTQIEGTITCFKENKPIPGAEFTIAEEQTAITDGEGKYHIRKIQDGIVTVKVHATGYKDSYNNGIFIKEGTVAHLDVALTPEYDYD
ncbi:carboxypeptidase-like regulatory domain-containing protein [Flavobacterium kingsejongi]|nr:carboxypeptidase-like regulatory domain-containing protein [Flavobacterium kingsejongi]